MPYRDKKIDVGDVRIVIADGEELIRHGIQEVVEAEESFFVVASADGEEATIRYVRGHRPDVLVIDPESIDVSQHLADTVRQISPNTKIVVYMSRSDPKTMRNMLQKNYISGMVLKDEPPRALHQAIAAAVRGSNYVNPRLAVELARAHDKNPLSDREEEVLRLIAHGYTNKEIGQQMYLSVRTIESHRSHIQHKLDVHTRHEMVEHAVEKGLFP